MWASVKAAFYTLTKPLEADIPHMYRDRLGYVTWGIGIKDDPLTDKTLIEPWVKCNGYRATVTEIRAEWNRTKAGPLFHTAAAKTATMHLPQDDRDAAFWDVVEAFERTLKSQFAGWATFHADPSLAILSHAWNMGPNLKEPPAPAGRGWPDLAAHCDDQDWEWCAQHCEPGDGPDARSRQNKVLFYQGVRAQLGKDAPQVLFGPSPVVTAARLAAAVKAPSVRDWQAWWVQAMLQDTGDYTYPLDGEFGSRSQAAWGKCLLRLGKNPGYTVTNLSAVSGASLRLGVG